MIVYNTALVLAAFLGLPFLLPAVLLSEKRRTAVRERLGLRGLPPFPEKGTSRRKRIWVHALSVGEVTSAVPLVRRLTERFPDREIFLSATTRTGFQTARRLLGSDVCALFFFPYDLPFSVNRIIRRVAPEFMVIVETDLWPNFLRGLHRRGVPIFLVNARISHRSYAGYRRLSFFTRPVFRQLTRIGVPSLEDGRRWAGLGVESCRIVRTGNLKFDTPVADIPPAERIALRRTLQIAPDRRVLVAGSTHDGEEDILKEAFLRLRETCPNLRMIVAPRDPRRAAVVRRMFCAAGMAAVSLAALENGAEPAFDILVIDRIGILKGLYAAGDLAFVGGSLVAQGGHNPLEPAAVAVPVLFGPHMSDFREIASLMTAAGGALEVKDGAETAAAVRMLLNDAAHRAAMGRAAYETVVKNRGAVDRTLALIEEGLWS